MIDPWNPTIEELQKWAFNGEDILVQDFELVVGRLAFADLILALAADDNCAMQSFFLHCAYFIIGNAIRSDFHTERKEDVIAFIGKAEASGNAYLLTFAQQAKELMQDHTKFDYHQWCYGRLAYVQFER